MAKTPSEIIRDVFNSVTGGIRISGHLVRNAAVVTKDDTNDIAVAPTLGLYVGTTGDIKAKMQDGTEVTFKAVPVGFFPVNVKRVASTGSTAADILALYAE